MTVCMCAHTNFNHSVTLQIIMQRIENKEDSHKTKMKGNKEVWRYPKQRIEIKEVFSRAGFVWEVIPQKEFQYVSIMVNYYITFILFFDVHVTFCSCQNCYCDCY